MLTEMLKQDDKKVAHAWLEAMNIVGSAELKELFEKTYKWVPVYNRPKCQLYYCSGCGYRANMILSKNRKPYRYCPNCRALMEDEDA